MKPHKGSHSVYSIHLYLVLVTKYRRQVITLLMIERMGEILIVVSFDLLSSIIN